MLNSKLLLLIVITLISTLGLSPLKASHFNSGEIYYKWSPTANDSNRYEIVVHWFRKDGAAQISGNSQVVCITSSCFNDISVLLNRVMPPAGMASPFDQNGGWRTSTMNDCVDTNNAMYQRTVVHKFSGFVSLPGTCADFKFTASAGCCRDITDNLLGNAANIFLEAQLNNTLGNSSSPEILASPGIALCLKAIGAPPSPFSQTAFDADGDSIRYVLKPAFEGPNCGPKSSVAYQAGYTASQPIPSRTGWNIDQKTGTFQLSPSQAGRFTVHIVVENYRFQAQSNSWVNIGNCSREMIIPVYTNCKLRLTDSIGLKFLGSANTTRSFTGRQADSLQNAYGVNYISRDNNGNVHLPTLRSYQCFDKTIKLDFKQAIRRNSIDLSDFRIIGPDSNIIPIVAVWDSSAGSHRVQSIYLGLYKALFKNGNYLLQIKTGNDGNTLIGDCGGWVPEWTSAFIEVRACPSPSFRLNQVTLKDDYNLMVHWTAGPLLRDTTLNSSFNAWRIYGRKNQGPWQLYGISNDPLSRRFEVDFGGSKFEVDNHQYEFEVELIYFGESWGRSRTCNNILLQELNVQHNTNEDIIEIAWTPYTCIPEKNRDYYVQYGRYNGGISVDWEPPIVTKDHHTFLSIPKTAGTGDYALRVYARHAYRNELPSESNWLIHQLQLNPGGINSGQTSWIIPNVITPNGDGQNDRFFMIIPPQDAGVQIIRLRIYNRQGVLEFEDLDFLPNNNAQKGWNGTNQNGQNLQNGTYYYIIQYIDPANGALKTLQGSINLQR